MMQTDCLLQDFILKETKGGALQRERENECEKKESNNVRFRFKTDSFRVNVGVRMSVKKKREYFAAFALKRILLE